MTGTRIDVPCPLGCRASSTFVVVGEDLLHGLPGRFTVLQCDGCGLMRTTPRPSDEALKTYYPDDYGPFLLSTPAEAPRSRLRDALSRLVDTRATAIPPLPPGRALELGCGSGSFVERLRTEGWDIAGLDPSSVAVRAAHSRGLPVAQGTAADIGPEPVYDLVAAWMVLEHLESPIDDLRRLRRATKSGGWLALSVPNAAALERRVFGPYWYALQVPTHLWHFTPSTLEQVLSRGGWTITKMIHQRTVSNAVGSLGHVATRAGLPALGRALLRYPTTARRSRYAMAPLAAALAGIGQTGRVTVWARAT